MQSYVDANPTPHTKCPIPMPHPQVLDRNPGQVVLGDLTRQLLLVERENKVRARLPRSKRQMMDRQGPSQNKVRAVVLRTQMHIHIGRK